MMAEMIGIRPARGGVCVLEVDGEPVLQLTPAGVRMMALGMMAAAERAEYDAALEAQLREDGHNDNDVALFMRDLHDRMGH